MSLYSKDITEPCAYAYKNKSNGVFAKQNPLHYYVPLLLLHMSLSTLLILFTYMLLKPLGQTKMISQILGGMILGPSVLGQIHGFKETLFPLRGFPLLDVFSIFGYVMYSFLIGVQTDPSLIKKVNRKTFAMGILTVLIPLMLSSFCAFLVKRSFGLQQKLPGMLINTAFLESIISFPTVAHYLMELKIINSEFGRMALSSSMVSNLFAFCLIMLYVVMRSPSSMRMVGSSLVIAIFVIFVIRPIILWMIRRTPQGKPPSENCIYFVLVWTLVAAFCSQAVGLNVFFGPLVLGMSIPPGPPLGSALIEKLDVIVNWLFMPLFFLTNGIAMNVFSVKPKTCGAVQLIILGGCVGKFLGSFLPSLFWKMPVKDALALGLVMNTQGLLELGIFKMMKLRMAIDAEICTIMIISMVIVTGVITPIVKYLYDPSRRYIVYNKRTIMHSKSDVELRILACIHGQENVSATINLLEAFSPTKQRPMAIYVLHLMELIGRANPLLIFHRVSKKESFKSLLSDPIVNAFRLYEQNNQGFVSVHPFTSISTYPTMHDDVCTIARDKRVSLVIIPYHKGIAANGALESFKKGHEIVNYNVLDKAPCSIGILVDRDRGLLNNSKPILMSAALYRIGVLFLGGADDREALAIGTRMASHPNISLTVIRLLEDGDTSTDGMGERGLDDELVTDFRLSTAGNHRVMYIEEVVMNGLGTLAVIKSMENNYELIMVGKHHDKTSPFTAGLLGWNEGTTYLGLIGEAFTSEDFKSNNTVLVVQQHTYQGNECHENQKEKLLQTIKMGRDMVDEEAEDTPMQKK